MNYLSKLNTIQRVVSRESIATMAFNESIAIVENEIKNLPEDSPRNDNDETSLEHLSTIYDAILRNRGLAELSADDLLYALDDFASPKAKSFLKAFIYVWEEMTYYESKPKR